MIRALVKPPKAHPKIRKITLYFTATIGEIITDMPLSLQNGDLGAKESHFFSFFPSFGDKLRLKTLNLRFSAKKQVNF